MDNWEVYAKIIDSIEPILAGVLSQKGVLHPEIIKYHWDDPDIQVRWTSDDLIERDIQILVLPPHNNHYGLRVGVSAWRDNESKNKRRWFYYNFPYHIEFGPDLEFKESTVANLREAINSSYDKIISIRKNDLTLEDKI